eukprot:355562-Chlamydomonas_euryale.AAC.1
MPVGDAFPRLAACSVPSAPANLLLCTNALHRHVAGGETLGGRLAVAGLCVLHAIDQGVCVWGGTCRGHQVVQESGQAQGQEGDRN